MEHAYEKRARALRIRRERRAAAAAAAAAPPLRDAANEASIPLLFRVGLPRCENYPKFTVNERLSGRKLAFSY